MLFLEQSWSGGVASGISSRCETHGSLIRLGNISLVDLTDGSSVFGANVVIL